MAPGRAEHSARERYGSGLILPLPSLADFTAPWRSTSYASDLPELSIERRFPPHLTLLVPWAAPDDVAALQRLGAVAAGHPPLDLVFEDAEMFPGTGVVWLVPGSAGAALAALLGAVWAAFPQHPPYEGRHDDPTPHVTVSADGDASVLAQVRQALRRHGPVRARADRISVYARGELDVWTERASVPLGGASR